MLIFCKEILLVLWGFVNIILQKPVGSLGKQPPYPPSRWPPDKCIKLRLGPGGTLDFKHPFHLKSEVPPGQLGFQCMIDLFRVWMFFFSVSNFGLGVLR